MASAPARFNRYDYPALRPFTPVLHREDGAIQVGLDQDQAVVLAGVSPALGQLLTRLDGFHRLPELRRLARELGVALNLLDWALRTLDQAQLLMEGESVSRRGPGAGAGRRIRLVGAGRLGTMIAESLLGSGIDVLYVVDNDPLDSELHPRGGAVGTQAEGLAAQLGSSGDTRITVLNHWSKPDGSPPDLTVVASDRLECDRVVGEALTRTDQPHLLVRARAGGVLVGPLVVPGSTACLRCTDLTRRDADPGWPVLLPQLQRMKVGISEAAVRWAGGVAATQVLAFLQGGTPESWGATVEISPADYITRRRSWSMHPGCGCGWGATAQW
ncbi:MAG: hypothetical protein ABWX96_10850 [Propionibacteriaceae bacterium]